MKKGNLANWAIPVRCSGHGRGGGSGRRLPRVIIAMEHATKDGQPKIVQQVYVAGR